MKNFFSRLGQRFTRFMYGRYGMDDMSKWMVGAALVLLVISLFFGARAFGTILYLIAFILLVWAYIRMFSKNIQKRYQQNVRFLQRKNAILGGKGIRSIRSSFHKNWDHLKQRKTHVFFKCPNCGQKMRTLRGQGEKHITCPKCHTQFTKKT